LWFAPGESLAIALRSAAIRVTIRHHGSALRAARTLVHRAKAKHPKARTFAVTATSGAVVIHPALTLTPR
jgi:hypothetical protein